MAGALWIGGLGPGDPLSRSLAVQQAIDTAPVIILRTAIHPGLDDLASLSQVVTCDDLYEAGNAFESIYSAIADRVLQSARERDTLYLVPGHPLFGETTTQLILERAADAGIPVRLLPSVSALDVMSSALRVDLLAAQPVLLDAVQLAERVDAEPFSGSALDVPTDRPILVSQVYDRAAASATKLWLGRLVPEDHSVAIVRSAGVPGDESVDWVPLAELDHNPVDHLTSVWVPALGSLDAARNGSTLHRISAALRAPDGCPWDREQDHRSLRTALVEEAFEVVDAIDADDPESLAEELGDLLLQVALHAQIAEEAGTFTIEDVYEQVNRKLVRRHPHVFGDGTADDADAVIQTWRGVKEQERAARGKVAPRNAYEKLPTSLPAIEKMRRLGLLGETGPAEPVDGIEAADEVVSLVERLARAGYDPAVEIDRAIARRFGRNE